MLSGDETTTMSQLWGRVWLTMKNDFFNIDKTQGCQWLTHQLLYPNMAYAWTTEELENHIIYIHIYNLHHVGDQNLLPLYDLL